MNQGIVLAVEKEKSHHGFHARQEECLEGGALLFDLLGRRLRHVAIVALQERG
jgi:hypothetical protein